MIFYVVSVLWLKSIPLFCLLLRKFFILKNIRLHEINFLDTCTRISVINSKYMYWPLTRCWKKFFLISQALNTIPTAAAAAKLLQSCLTLCNLRDGSPPGSPIPGILQARTLEWVAISFSNTWKWKVKVKSLSRVWLGDPMDCSLPGSSIHGIFQARVLEWGAIAFSKHT